MACTAPSSKTWRIHGPASYSGRLSWSATSRSRCSIRLQPSLLVSSRGLAPTVVGRLPAGPATFAFTSSEMAAGKMLRHRVRLSRHRRGGGPTNAFKGRGGGAGEGGGGEEGGGSGAPATL